MGVCILEEESGGSVLAQGSVCFLCRGSGSKYFQLCEFLSQLLSAPTVVSKISREVIKNEHGCVPMKHLWTLKMEFCTIFACHGELFFF